MRTKKMDQIAPGKSQQTFWQADLGASGAMKTTEKAIVESCASVLLTLTSTLK